MARPAFFNYVIIGGGVAGVSAAEAIRRRDAGGSILIILQEAHPLYSRVLLPNYARRKIEREKVFLRSWEQYQALRIDVSVGERVIGVNYETREITTSRDQIIAYGKLLIAAGSTPNAWSMRGEELGTVFRLQTIEDADRIRETMPKLQQSGKPACVIGGGFIGLEFIETAVSYGFETHVLLRGRWLFEGAITEEGWDMLSHTYERNNVKMHPSTELKYLAAPKEQQTEEGEVKQNLDYCVGHTNTNEELPMSWIGVGVGIARNIAPFSTQGFETGKGIRTNQYLETTQPHVWAAGDIAEYFDVSIGEYRVVGNWTNAFLQGKIAGENMASESEKKQFETVSTYTITNLGNQFTFVGKTELSDGMHDIVRIIPENRAYERLFIKNGTIQGAVIINRFSSKAPISALISSRTDISSFEESLRNPYAEITQIIQ